MNLKGAFKKVGYFLKKHRSTIISGLSVAGVVGTFALTIKANNDANERRHEAQAEKGEELTTWERIKAETPAYILPGALCLVTSGSIIVNDILNVKQKKTLIGLACAGAMSYSKLSKEAKEEIAKEGAERNAEKRKETKCHSDEEKLWYDDYSERYFWATKDEVRCAELDVSNMLLYEGTCPLNRFYDSIGNPDDLPHEREYDDVGWSTYIGDIWYGYSYPEFEHCPATAVDPDTGEETEYTIIYMPYPPTYDYLADPYENV